MQKNRACPNVREGLFPRTPLFDYKHLLQKNKTPKNPTQPLPCLECFAVTERTYLEVIQGNDVFMFQFLEKIRDNKLRATKGTGNKE